MGFDWTSERLFKVSYDSETFEPSAVCQKCKSKKVSVSYPVTGSDQFVETYEDGMERIVERELNEIASYECRECGAHDYVTL